MADSTFIKGAESSQCFEIKRYGYSMSFTISPDEIECHCTYEPSASGGPALTEVELTGHLAQFKIREGVIPEAVATLLNSAANLKLVDGLLLARGIPMRPGDNGKILLATADDVEVPETDKPVYESIDFRNVQTFLNVESGDLVATISSPGPGIPGKTVLGKTIAPRAGEPASLELGLNVTLQEDGMRVYATDSGRVYLRGSILSVEDVYEIDGNVDFRVGNISFKGFVEIKGDVLDGFLVKASRGIKVQGNIGVSIIECEGDVIFCGMSGQGGGSIMCGGNISANFIYDTTIECSGDISAAVEIRNSQIKCLGAISVAKGGLTGGEYFALAGIECGNLGSMSAMKTRVVAGVHFGDLEDLNKLFNELKQLVAEFSAAPKGSIDMKEFAAKRADITARTQEVRSRSYVHQNPKINVSVKLFEGVSITLGMISENIIEERKGPMSIIENTIDGGLRYLGMTTLSHSAQTIEQSFEQQRLFEQQRKQQFTQEESS